MHVLDEGGTTNNYELLSSAFHTTEVNALEFFKSRIKPGPDQDRETRIVHLDITGSAAHAKLELRYDGFSFIDYINLLKINGGWKIVNKIFFRESHK